MSLYDDIEPTVKRPRTFETPEVTISAPEKKYGRFHFLNYFLIKHKLFRNS